jgi:hypothetical protein
MPFENSLVVIALKEIKLLKWLISLSLKKITSVSRVTLQLTKIKLPKIFSCKESQFKRIYYVGTNDYLSNGGDNMNFFKRVQKFDYNTSCEIY